MSVANVVTFATAHLAQSPPARRLPVRDGDVVLYAIAGLALLLVGALLIYASRRRP